MRNCCPSCTSKAFTKNGFNRYGGQNNICRNCGKQFLLDPKENNISQATKRLIQRLLLERLSLEGICRVTGVSMCWLLKYIPQIYELTPDNLGLTIPSDSEGVMLSRVEADELWSFVGSKKNKQWVWLALDVTTRQIIAFYVGGRGAKESTLQKALSSLIPKAISSLCAKNCHF